MRLISFVVICGLILLSGSASGETTNSFNSNGKCAVPNTKTSLLNSSAVFAGKVLKITKDGNKKTFEFQVEKYWKGIKGKRVELSVTENARYQAWFRVGEKYLVFARRDEDGRLSDGRCSASKSLSEAAAELKELGRAKIPR